MYRVKCFFSWIRFFLTEGIDRLIGYFVASVVIWNVLVFVTRDYGELLDIRNVVYVIFSVLGCVVGIHAASIFSSRESGDLFRSVAPESGKPFVQAALAEFLKAAVSVWIAAYTSIFLCWNVDIVILHLLVLLAIEYLFLYFSLGLLAGSLTENSFYRIAFCVLYYLLNSGLTYVIYRYGDSNVLKAIGYPFAYNAPFLNTETYRMFEHEFGCIVISVFPEESIITFAELFLMGCLFFIIAIVKFNKKSKAGSRAFSVQ